MLQINNKDCRLGILFTDETSAMLWEITKNSPLSPQELLEDAIKMMYKNYKNKELNSGKE